VLGEVCVSDLLRLQSGPPGRGTRPEVRVSFTLTTL
jgi:hypothetical protein